jgi:hypothetical protein
MTRSQTKPTRIAIVVAVLAIAVFAGCAAKKSLWGDPETGLILQYRMQEDQTLQYEISNVATQTMEVGGNSIDVDMSEFNRFSVQSKGLEDSKHQLSIVLDSVYVGIGTPGGLLSPDMSSVAGKGFDMTLSVLGQEGELAGAEAIEYSLGGGGTRNVSASFQALFLNLPGKPLKVGDSWATQDTISESGSTGETTLTFDTTNTLAGYETVDGFECAKITEVFTGTLSGSGNEGGMDLTYDGVLEGTGTTYFAYKKGLLIRTTGTGTADATISGSGPQEITIPMKREYTMETRLVR